MYKLIYYKNMFHINTTQITLIYCIAIISIELIKFKKHYALILIYTYTLVNEITIFAKSNKETLVYL